ncbi:methyltransferase domain-containing protein [Chloroflexi bacterium TSY]|nr:methyltransferase domain-containing protein [Chloroflexi bacterium TSY]
MKLFASIQLYSHLVYYQLFKKNAGNYVGQWDNYWRGVQETGPKGQVMWDNVPDMASAGDLRRFKEHMNPELPIVDLGCGNGRQTRFLAQHFARVVGVDVSPAAIQKAQAETAPASNIEFRVLNAINPEEAATFHDEFGDVNIYVRGVLHVIQKADRAKFMESQ